MDEVSARDCGNLKLVVTSVSSDAHTWNLVYLHLLLGELGHDVTNLGACVPEDLLVQRCLELSPDLIVMSSVNGHGWSDGARAVGRLRAEPQLARTTTIIGGKLSIDGIQGGELRASLLDAGFDEVFDGEAGAVALVAYLDTVPRRLVA